MRLHNILVEAVVESLRQIFFEERYADKVIEKILKSNPKWGARDRAFIAENVYEIVRNWRLLANINQCEGKELASLSRMVGTWFLMKGYEPNDWAGFRHLEKNTIDAAFQKTQNQRVIRESIPDWLDEASVEELGEPVWEKEIKAMNEPAKVILRVNTLKTDVATLQQNLTNEQILTDILSDTPDALVLRERKNIFTSPFFKEGHFEVQDAGSQWIAPMLDVQPRMRVIDACAGAGGKTLHLSALMQNKGSLIAMDIEEFKLLELKKRAKRGGVGNVETRWIENSKTIKRLHDSADRLLLDVPCSGLGVLRRNPDAKWKMSPVFIEKVQITQRVILENYSKMLRKEGKMVYATCSLLPSESEDQVQWFLDQQDGRFELLEQKRCSPAQHGYDGFYMACLKKIA
jgi:16S rRNA (cytosine967-C5)-methyltransferase